MLLTGCAFAVPDALLPPKLAPGESKLKVVALLTFWLIDAAADELAE